MGINLPNGANVEEIVLPNGSQASEVIAPDGSTIWERVAIPDTAVAQFNAKELTGLSDGDTVTTWPDEVSGNDATGSGTYRPSGISNEPSVEFAPANNDGFEAPIGSYSQPNTAFFFVLLEDTSNGHQIIDGGVDGGSRNMARWVASDANWEMFAGNTDNVQGSGDSASKLISVRFDGSNSVLREDSVQTGSGDLGDDSIDDITIGNSAPGIADAIWDGDISFVEFHNAGLTDSEMSDREQEIADLFGHTL